MDESVHVGDNGPAPPKPPLSVGRIAGEILAGTAVGCAAADLARHVVVLPIRRADCMGFGALAVAWYVLPPVYALGAVVGVYLVGKTGKQTGSFTRTLCGGLVGGLAMFLLLPFAFFLACGVSRPLPASGLIEMISWIVQSPAILAPAVLIPPIVATLGFNSTRRWGSPRLAWFRGTTLAVLLLAACATLLIEVRTYARDRARGQINRMNSQYARQTELIKGLQSRDARVREAAARALGRRGYEARPAVPALVDALKDEDEVVRQRARAALERIDPNWSRTVKPE